jgi:2-hydroxychromene-2-carboxylate isomerase
VLAAGKAKIILAENTDRAFADGAFGLPWFACENDRGEREGFWGVDRLSAVLDFFGLEKPTRNSGWRAML